MVTDFTVFGSCTCRDIFNSSINKNYKDFFKIGGNGIRLSFISIMQAPVEYNAEDLRIFPEEDENIHFSRWIKNDFDKIFLDELKENKFEYMLMDTYYDVNFGIVDIGDNHYVTNNIRLNKTKFYDELKNKHVLKITENKNEYFKLWKEHCDLFFNFIDENCPNIKIILNPSRHVYKILKNDGTITESKIYKEECDKFNTYRDLLDSYILENFDVDVLNFNPNTLASEESPWGVSSLHYYSEYFKDMTNQLNQIIKRNGLLSTGEYALLNKDIRKYKRNNILTRIKQQYNNNRFGSNELTISEDISTLKKYNEKILNTFIYDNLNADRFKVVSSPKNLFYIIDLKNKFPKYEYPTQNEAEAVCSFLNEQEEIIIRLFKKNIYNPTE